MVRTAVNHNQRIDSLSSPHFRLSDSLAQYVDRRHRFASRGFTARPTIRISTDRNDQPATTIPNLRGYVRHFDKEV